MKNKEEKRSLSDYLTLSAKYTAGLALYSSILVGCAKSPKFDLSPKEIRERALERLKKIEPIPNEQRIIKGQNPIYENPWIIKPLSDNYDLIEWRIRYVNAQELKSNLESQYKGILEDNAFTISPSLNKLFIKVPKRQNPETGNLEPIIQHGIIREVIEKQDELPPHIQCRVVVERVAGDYTKDVSSLLELRPLEGHSGPEIRAELLGATLRTPERALMGGQYGLITEIGTQMLHTFFDTLESSGVAVELTDSTFAMTNLENGYLSRTLEIPIPRDIPLANVGLVKTIDFKPIENFVKVKAKVMDNGMIEIFGDMQVAELIASGATQQPIIITRKATIPKVAVRGGNTVIIATLKNEREFLIERGAPPLSDIPVLGGLVRSKDVEYASDQIYVSITPYFIDMSLDLGEVKRQELQNSKLEEKVNE